MAAGTLTVKVPGIPVPLVFGEHVHDRDWSTSRLGTTQSAELPILSAAEGETIPGGTAILSNREATLPAGGQRGYPVGYEAFVYSIQLVFGSATGAKYNNAVPVASGPTDGDLAQVYARALFRFSIQGKRRAQGPLYKFPSGGGMFLTGADDTNATNRLRSNNGMPSPRDQAAFIVPHHLEPNVPFKGAFLFDAAVALGQTFDIEGHIEGLLRRPVQ
jgi:hypothetical protein